MATTLAVVAPARVMAAEPGVPIAAAADTWVTSHHPLANHGSETRLAARADTAHAYLKFDLRGWYGRPIAGMELHVGVKAGPATALRLRLTGTRWSEPNVTWLAKPRLLSPRTVSIETDGGIVRPASERRTSINVLPFFANGFVDRMTLGIRLASTSSTTVLVASRESSQPPRLVLWAPTAPDGEATTAARQMPLRFYTPNIIARGDNQNPPRDTTADQMEALFSNSSSMAPVLRNVDVYSFFGSSLGRGDPAYDTMVRRAIPMLASYGVKVGLELGGPLGYNPGVVYGADTNGENGRKSANFDLNARIGKVEAMGGRVDYLMLDGALRRTILNGVHRSPHVAFVTFGTAANSNALTYRARSAGAQGNSVRVTYAVPGANNPLGVVVSGNDIVVHLATDAAGRSVSTASQVKAALEASAAATALVTVTHYAGSSGAGIVPPRAATSLTWGDNGLNMTIDQSVNELVSYIRTVNQARPNIRFVLLEDVILWPYDGKPGYASVQFPQQQRPDFKVVWERLVDGLRSAGLLKLLSGFHNDSPVEYFLGQVPSIYRDADDWFRTDVQAAGPGGEIGRRFRPAVQQRAWRDPDSVPAGFRRILSVAGLAPREQGGGVSAGQASRLASDGPVRDRRVHVSPTRGHSVDQNVQHRRHLPEGVERFMSGATASTTVPVVARAPDNSPYASLLAA